MDPIKEAMIREDDTGEINPALDPYRERPQWRCVGCDGHECDSGCAYPGVGPGPLTPMGMARELVDKWHVEYFGLKIGAWKLELLASRIAALMVENTMQAVREFEDYNGKHQRASLEIERLRNALRDIEMTPQPAGGGLTMYPPAAEDWEAKFFTMTDKARAALNALSVECAHAPDPASRQDSEGGRSIRLGATEIAAALVGAWHDEFCVVAAVSNTDAALGELTRRIATVLVGEPHADAQ